MDPKKYTPCIAEGNLTNDVQYPLIGRGLLSIGTWVQHSTCINYGAPRTILKSLLGLFWGPKMVQTWYF